jgi:hypothetical protein
MSDIATTYEDQAQAPGQPDALDEFDKEEELIKKITSNLKEGRKHWSKWRTQAREDYDFYASNQWSEEDARKLDSEGRPAVVFNRTARTVNAIKGLEIQSRQEIRFFPREVTDTGVGEYYSAAGKWARDLCDAEDEESDAFEDLTICGIGWTESRMDYEEDQEGLYKKDRIDPLEMLVDPTSKKRNFADSKWRARILELTRAEVEEYWPDADIQASQFWQDFDTEPHDATNAWKYENDYSDRASKQSKYSIVQYQWWERECFYKVMDGQGNINQVSEEKFKAQEKLIKAVGWQYVKQYKRVFKQAFLCGNKLLDDPIELACERFTFNAMTGLRDRNNNTYFGIVTLMKDPQRWANKWLSQIQYILNTSAKNGLLAEEDAISNPRQFEEEYARAGTISFVRAGAISGGKIQPKEAPRYPDGIDRLLQHALQSINDVPGVNLELIGMAGRDQAIGLEETRKQAGVTMLATFFDNLRRYRKEEGRVLAHFIREYLADGRLIRIVGEQGAQYVPLIKEKLTFEYDIIVDEAPTSPAMKEKVFAILSNLMPVLMQAGIPIPPDILDYTPFPSALTEKWKQLIASSSQDPHAEELKNINMMLAQLEGKKKESEIYLNYAKAEQAHATGENEAALASNKMQIMAGEHALDMHAIQQEQARKDAEFAQEQNRKTQQSNIDNQRADLEMMLNQRRKLLEAQINAKIKAQESAFKVSNARQ